MAKTGVWCVLVGVALGCSSGGDGVARPGAGTGAVDPAGRPGETGHAGDDGAGNDGAGDDFGNAGEVPAAAPMEAPSQEPAPVPMGGGRMPMAVDACGADNPAGLDADALQTLMAGGGAGLRVLYPYDGTVFPRGILPPTLMWDGAGGEYVYLRITSRLLDYHGCLPVTAPGQLVLPQDLWELMGLQTDGGEEPYRVEVSVMAAGAVSGPVALGLTVAQATLKGSIYYNSYSSRLAGGLGGLAGGGAILRIPPGGPAEASLGRDGCTGCHSVSANGARLMALPLVGAGLLGGAASSYALSPDVMANPPAINAALANGAFTGLSPDGTLFLTSAHGGAPPLMIVGPRAGGPGAVGGPTAGLFETDSGAAVPNSGLPEGAMMGTFSPDATQITFSDLALDQGRGLAVMRFDLASRTASDYRPIYRTGDDRYAGWPFFLPDGHAVVFANGLASDYSGLGAGVGLGGVTLAIGPASDLYMVDVASGQAVLLARAMGFATEADAASGNTYLPFGAQDLHRHYYPTVAPVAAGGYFWIFFDSIRHYGNQGLQRQIWGAAIDVAADGTYGVDRSHPAFYLTGQEANTGNHRAFAALDPCEMDGEGCTSGTDCCGGFCYVTEANQEFAEPGGTCTSETPECARVNERCSTSADCCPPEAGQGLILCIAGFCAEVGGPD